jgi:uncharacterized protein YllA (UPF0747 family)
LGNSIHDADSQRFSYGRYAIIGQRVGRDRMGRFVSRDGSEMAHKLREMMRETTDDGLKAEIRRLAEKMESM